MVYKQGTPRNQLLLYNECIDELVAPDSYVRIIDAYIEKLHLEELGFQIHELRTGAPPYRNQLLLKIYLYGILDRERSSRRLEKACRRNNEMIWLTEGLAPDFKTIANFRKNNKKGLQNIFKAFLEFCHQQGLVTFETLAVDSTTMRAQNSMNTIFKRSEIKKIKKKIEQRINEYIEELDFEDEKEAFNLKVKNADITKVIEKLNNLKKYEYKVDEAQKKFDEDKKLNTYFATDPDSRFQSDKGKVRAGYNVQTVGDNMNKLIVAVEVTQKSNDLEQMTTMVSKIKEIKTEFEIDEESNVIMDAGYFSEKEIVNNKDEKGINIYVSEKKESAKTKKEKKGTKSTDKVPAKKYELQNFKYDKENDMYICPKGKMLYKTHLNPGTEKSGRKVFEYQCYDCGSCEDIKYCTKNKRGRAIKVSVEKECMDSFKESMKSEANKKIISKRKEIIEHPFGTLKRNLGYTYFMQRGLENVKTEFSFMCFAYNFKRVLNILKFDEQMQAIHSMN